MATRATGLWAFSTFFFLAILTFDPLPGSDVTMYSLSVPSYYSARPGKLVGIRADMKNESAKRAEGALVVTLDGFPSLTFKQRFSIPANTEFSMMIPVFLPKTVVPGSRVDAKVAMQLDVDGSMTNVREEGSRVFETVGMYIDPDTNVSLMLLDPNPDVPFNWDWRVDGIHRSYELMVALRVQAGLTRRAINVSQSPITADPQAWETYDTVVLASNEYLRDLAAVGAMQSWIARGGRMWIMLDKVDPDLIAPLLGVAGMVRKVGEVELDRVELETTDFVNAGPEDMSYEVSPPARMTKAIFEGIDVTHTIHGWPVVGWTRLGQGEIILTTLEARAWIKNVPTRNPSFVTPPTFDPVPMGDGKSLLPPPGRPNGGRPPGQNPGVTVVAEMVTTSYSSRPWVGTLPRRFFGGREPQAHAAVMASMAADRIGLPVFSREIVALVLGGFVFILFAIVCYLHRAKRLEWIGWIAPLLAIGFAVPVIFYAMESRKEVPAQVSVVQAVDASSGLDRALVMETSAVYQPAANEFSVWSEGGGMLTPSHPLVTDHPLHRTGSPLGRWEWSTPRWPAGIWSYNSQYDLPYHATAMLGKFTARGLEMELSNSASLASPLEDVLVFWPPANAAIAKPVSNGKWIVSSEDMVEGKNWVAGSLLTDLQLDRQKVYAALLGKPEQQPYASPTPVVMGWSQSIDSPVSNTPNIEKKGQSFWTFSLRMSNPVPGNPIDIPSWAIRARPLKREAGFSIAFRDTLGRWAGEFTQPTTVDLRFELPKAAQPIQVSKAVLKIKALAPERKLRIDSLSEDKSTELRSVLSPTGVLSIDLAERDLAALSNGSLDLRVDVSDLLEKPQSNAIDPSDAPKAVKWRIESMNLEVQGKAVELQR